MCVEAYDSLDLSGRGLASGEDLVEEAAQELKRRGETAWDRIRYLYLDGNEIAEIPG